MSFHENINADQQQVPIGTSITSLLIDVSNQTKYN